MDTENEKGGEKGEGKREGEGKTKKSALVLRTSRWCGAAN